MALLVVVLKEDKMVKIVLLTIWCMMGLMVHLLSDGESGKYSFCGKLWNTIIWVSFICWFAA